MRISETTLRQLAAETGVNLDSAAFDVLRLRYVEGQSYREISVELGCKDLTARKIASRWKRRVYLREQERQTEPSEPSEAAAAMSAVSPEEQAERLALGRKGQLSHALYLIEEQDTDAGLDAMEEARTILSAISGHQPCKPATPTFDDQGRKVGGGSEPMTADELARYIRRAERERAQPVRFVRTAVPVGWRVGRMCDMGGRGVKAQILGTK